MQNAEWRRQSGGCDRARLRTLTLVFSDSRHSPKWENKAVFILHSALCILHSIGGAPLIPKLRGYFAEFLREVSLARLGLLDPPTCVGLRDRKSTRLNSSHGYIS